MSYWEKRQEQKYTIGERKIKDYYNDLQKAFERSKRDIQKVINDFVIRYGTENETPSYAEARRRLDKAEIGELQDFIDRVKENVGKYDQDLSNMSIKARITRYDALEKQIDAMLQELYIVEYELKGTELMKELYTDSYHRTWFNIDQYQGFHQEFASVNMKAMEELINYPFDGAAFSTRIWKQKGHLEQQLKESITTMLIQGKNPRTLSSQFANKFQAKEKEAFRLLHTEGSFIMEQGTLAAYKEDDLEQYKILATLDNRTSDKCRNADSDVHYVKDAVVGKNYPPLHVLCRSTTIPYYDDMDLGKRIASDSTGKNYEVPADMSYKEWHKEYVENNQSELLAEKKWKNRYADKKQFESYSNILGSESQKHLMISKI